MGRSLVIGSNFTMFGIYEKAWKHALELGLRPEQIKKGLTTGITISIMPTLPVLLVLLSLMPLLGVPLPWLRLSIIGSAYYETYAATTALECVGETMKLNEYSAVGWVVAAWVMTIEEAPVYYGHPLQSNRFPCCMKRPKRLI